MANDDLNFTLGKIVEGQENLKELILSLKECVQSKPCDEHSQAILLINERMKERTLSKSDRIFIGVSVGVLLAGVGAIVKVIIG